MKRLLRVLCALFAVALVAMAFVLHTSHRVFAVRTGSMSPGIPAKALVLIEVGHYRLGQPISFHTANGIVTHRLVSRNADGTYVTKGDANNAADVTPVPARDIIGGVVASEPNLGFWWVYVSTPVGAASIAFSAILLYLIWGLFADPPPPERPVPELLILEPLWSEPATTSGRGRWGQPTASNLLTAPLYRRDIILGTTSVVVGQVGIEPTTKGL